MTRRMQAHPSEHRVGTMQHYVTREGRTLKMARRRDTAHRLSDELVPPRMPIEPVRFGWHDAIELVASFVVIGLIYLGFIVWVAIASASTVTP